MKTLANSIVSILARGTLLVGALAIIITSCTQVESPFSVEESDVKSFEDLNINVKYAESYDQTTITFSRHWPSSISSGFEKVSSNSDGEFMMDYERVHKVVAFDEDGYMSTSIEFLEGDSEMGMPEETYERLKNTMPAKGMEYDPLIRILSVDGIEKGFSKSGAVLYELEYNPEEYRIDLDLIDSLNQTNNTFGIENSVQNNVLKLESEGFSFEITGQFFAKYELDATLEQEKFGIGAFNQVMDLRSGEIIASSIQDLNGGYLEVVENRYEKVNGNSVLSKEIRYSFGEVNGEWGVSTRTVTQRENIQIIKN